MKHLFFGVKTMLIAIVMSMAYATNVCASTSVKFYNGDAYYVTASLNVVTDYYFNNKTFATSPTKTGYTFAGWYSSSDGGVMVFNSNGKVDKNCSTNYWTMHGTYAVWRKNSSSERVYSHWTANTYTNTLNYDANGGSGAPSAQTANVSYPSTSKSFTISSTVPTKAGYKFLGWSTSSTATSASYSAGGSTTVGSSSYAGNQSVTLYAVWAKQFTDLAGTVSTSSSTSENVVDVINKTCANLVLDDDKTISSSLGTFTATTATYTRDLGTGKTWGTICLPYEVSSDATVQYYTFSGVTNGVVNFTKVDVLEAGTPALVKVLSGTNIEATASNVTVSTTAQTSSNDSYKFVGNLGSKMQVGNSDGTAEKCFYVKNNQFVRGNQYFNIGTYRAYLDGTSASSNAKGIMNVSFDSASTTGINEVVSGEDANVAGIYNAQGKLIPELQQGLNIVKYADGSVKKIMIK